MRRRVLLVPVLAALLGAAPAQAGEGTDDPDAVPGQSIVGVRGDVSRARLEALVAERGGRVAQHLRSVGAAVVRPRDGSAGGAERLRARLRALRAVRYAEPDYVLRTTRTPDDPFYLRQYALQGGAGGISAPTAWDARTSCALVAALDSGVQYDHPDLRPSVWHNPGEVKANGKDDDRNGWVDDYYGVNVPKGSGSGKDDDGHGTHVAGIIGGRGDNATGVTGACWSAKVMPVRFMNQRGRGSVSDAIQGIAYAIREGAKIVNCSFGSSQRSRALEDAVDDAKQAGVLLVVAAGNDGRDIDRSPSYPASYTQGNILTVAATDAQAGLASFSNTGAKAVDLAAPGANVYSTYPTSSYRQLSGTSMAAPMVSAAAAMLRQQDPHLSYGELRSRLKAAVDPSPALAGRTVTGGKLNLARTLSSVR